MFMYFLKSIAPILSVVEQDLFMRKVRFLGELMSCVGMCRFLLAIPRNPYDIAEEAKLKCHYFEEEVIFICAYGNSLSDV